MLDHAHPGDTKVTPEATSKSPSTRHPSRKPPLRLGSASLAPTSGIWGEVDVNQRRDSLRSLGAQEEKHELDSPCACSAAV